MFVYTKYLLCTLKCRTLQSDENNSYRFKKETQVLSRSAKGNVILISIIDLPLLNYLSLIFPVTNKSSLHEMSSIRVFYKWLLLNRNLLLLGMHDTFNSKLLEYKLAYI